MMINEPIQEPQSPESVQLHSACGEMEQELIFRCLMTGVERKKEIVKNHGLISTPYFPEHPSLYNVFFLTIHYSVLWEVG